jgi:hypothetical protein
MSRARSATAVDRPNTKLGRPYAGDGSSVEAPKERVPAKVINLMDALRRSVDAERGRTAKQQAPSVKARGSESERPKKKRSR